MNVSNLLTTEIYDCTTDTIQRQYDEHDIILFGLTRNFTPIQ